MITRTTVAERLTEQHIGFVELALGGGLTVFVTRFGGRILGPFLPAEFGEASQASLSWLNDGFRERAHFEEVLHANGPLGGERIWISPEVQFGTTDRDRFWETLFVPADVDPGSYSLTQPSAESIVLSQEMMLEAYNTASGRVCLALERVIAPTADPLRELRAGAELVSGVTFAGYRHSVTLSDRNPGVARSEPWSLIQVWPGGTVVIPTLASAEYTDYYDPAPASLVEVGERALRARITGDRQYKIGVKAASVIGRIGYRISLGGAIDALIVRNYANNPSMPYVDQPPARPSESGFSTHVYNDGGQFGGFGEIENMGTPIGSDPLTNRTTDVFETWFYIGAPHRVDGISTQLLGVYTEPC